MWLVSLYDRHTDPEHFLFQSEDAAREKVCEVLGQYGLDDPGFVREIIVAHGHAQWEIGSSGIGYNLSFEDDTLEMIPIEPA